MTADYKTNSFLISDEDLLRLEVITNSVIERMREHFNKSGAWDISVDLIVSDLINEFFNADIYSYLARKIQKTTPGVSLINRCSDYKTVFRNTKEKVFYNPIKNKIYIATQVADANCDINLGDLE